MNRRNFIQKSSAISLLATGSSLGADAFKEPYLIKGFDKLINEKGEYVLPPLPYDFNALEP